MEEEDERGRKTVEAKPRKLAPIAKDYKLIKNAKRTSSVENSSQYSKVEMRSKTPVGRNKSFIKSSNHKVKL